MTSKPSITFTALLMCAALFLGTGCREGGKETTPEAAGANGENTTQIESRPFGQLEDGRGVTLYTIRNASGMELRFMDYGGIITYWSAPDAEGNFEDVVLGFDTLEPYLEGHPFFGALVGRYGNRIAGAAFTLDGETYSLAKNNGENHLHGGLKGFDKVLWEVRLPDGPEGNSAVLTYTSPDMEEGYPGNLKVTITYSLTEAGELDIRYEATTDAPTIVNLTQHVYFNLSGHFTQSIEDHLLTLQADAFLPVDDGLIPTGEIRPVSGTPFDFTQPKPIGEEIDAADEQLAIAGGYDHCWVLNDAEAGFRQFATVVHPATGRKLEVATDEPGVQFYTGNFLDGSLPAKGGGTYGKRSGFCLETQHYPDSPNQEAFPSVRLDPGQTYRSHTRFKLSAKASTSTN